MVSSNLLKVWVEQKGWVEEKFLSLSLPYFLWVGTLVSSCLDTPTHTKLTPSALLVLMTGSSGSSPSQLQLILRLLNFHDQINQFLVIISFFFSFSVFLSHYNSSCAHYQYFSYTTLLCFSNMLACFKQATLILVASTDQNSHDSFFSGFFSFQHWFKCNLCYS